MPFVKIDDINMYYKVIINGKEVNEVDKSMPTMIVLHGGPGIVDHQIELNF